MNKEKTKALKYINRLTKSEINTFLNSIGYELEEELYDDNEEKIPSYEKCNTVILCRCKKLKENQVEIKINGHFSKLMAVTAAFLDVCKYFSFATTLIFITDFDCYPAMVFNDEAEQKQAEFFTVSLWNYLTEKFGNAYLNDLRAQNEAEHTSENNEVEK